MKRFNLRKNISFAVFIFLLTGVLIKAQEVGYVEYNNPVYSFLNRMDALGVIEKYDPFEIPKTREEICGYILAIEKHREDLDDIDNAILDDLNVEFEYDIKQTTMSYSALLKGDVVAEHFTDQKEKFIYYSTEPGKFSLFVNLLGEAENLSSFSKSADNLNSFLYNFGGAIRGTIGSNLGYYLKGTNGTYIGSKSLAKTKQNLKYNYKFNLPDDAFNTGVNYYDEAEGYLAAKLSGAYFKIGRDRNLIGYGPIKYIFGDDSPQMDYLSFTYKYSFVNFSYFHGNLLGNVSYSADSLLGVFRNVDDKFIAYHRFGFNFTKHFTFGLGEMAIYSNRSIDLSYLNPFAFYKNAEHSDQDRDNTLMFLDFTNNSFEGLKFYGTLLIDDLNFDKWGTAWFGNQALISLSAYSTQLYKILPLEFEAQYLRIDPYFYAHRTIVNNYTNNGFNLGAPYQPNTEVFHFGAEYRFTNRLSAKVFYRFGRHGANELNPDGSIKVNHGGDIVWDRRRIDSEYAHFLDGVTETLRQFYLQVYYEPVNNIRFLFTLQNINNDLQSGEEKYFRSSILMKVRI